MQTLRDLWGGLVDRVNSEPVFVLQLVQAGLSLAVGFGLGWSGEQVALTVTFVGTILSLVSRKQVTPNSKLPA